MQKKNQLIGTLFLLTAAVLWGFSFVFQNEGVDILDPFAFNGIRSLLGAIALVPVIFVIHIIAKKNGTYKKPSKQDTKAMLIGGFWCGLVLCTAGTLQTLGIKQGSGEAGFITTIYIVFVPILGIFLRQKIEGRVWIAVMMCFVGLYLLCGSFALNINQIYLLLCAFFFAIHILVIDHFAPKTDGVKLSALQFLVVGIIDCIIMIFVDCPTWNEIWLCFWPNLAYSGFVSCSIAYTCQIVGQKYISPTMGSLLMSLESVFAVVGGWLLQGDVMSAWQITGCAIIFAAIVIVQLPPDVFRLKKINNIKNVGVRPGLAPTEKNR